MSDELDVLTQQMETLSANVDKNLGDLSGTVNTLAAAVTPMVERESARVAKEDKDEEEKKSFIRFQKMLKSQGYSIKKDTRGGGALATEEKVDVSETTPSNQQRTIQGAMDDDEAIEEGEPGSDEWADEEMEEPEHMAYRADDEDEEVAMDSHEGDMEEKGGPREGVPTHDSPRRQQDPDESLTVPKPGRELWKNVRRIDKEISGLKRSVDSLSVAVKSMPEDISKALEPKMAQLNGWTPGTSVGTGIPAVQVTGANGAPAGDITLIKSDGEPQDKESRIAELRKLPLSTLNDMRSAALAGQINMVQG
jgi:hypothetical protein